MEKEKNINCDHQWVFTHRTNEGIYSSDPYFVNYFICPKCEEEKEVSG